MPARDFGLKVPLLLLRFIGCTAILVACGDSDGNGSISGTDSGARGASADGGTSENLTVTTAQGPVQADTVGGVRRFLKIPYAQPPVGSLRCKAPVKSAPWTEVRHETSFASECPQSASAQDSASTDERA